MRPTGSWADDYLSWRMDHGFASTFEAVLTRPFVIHHYDVAYCGEGILAPQTSEHQRTSQYVAPSWTATARRLVLDTKSA
jgi:hypothetical protein